MMTMMIFGGGGVDELMRFKGGCARGWQVDWLSFNFISLYERFVQG